MSIMSHIDAALTAMHGEGYVVLTAAEASWIGDAVTALRNLSGGSDYNAERVVIGAGCAEYDRDNAGDLSDEELATAIMGMVLVLVENDHEEAARLAAVYGQPNPR